MLHPYTLPSRTKPTRKPKLGKEYGCPTTRQKTMEITVTNRPTNHDIQGLVVTAVKPSKNPYFL
jgi:hypothetical protein